MRTTLLLTALASLTACSKTSVGKQIVAGDDDCAKFINKSANAIEKMVVASKRTFTPEELHTELEKMVVECRRKDSLSKPKSEVVVKCVLDASSEAAVADCWQAAMGDYTKSGKRSTTALNLNRIRKAVKVNFEMNGALLRGSAGPTPPGNCCESPDKRCAVTDWSNPVWDELGFSIDEPSHYQYSFQSDGATVKVTAIGDEDCDGTPSVATLTCSAPSGVIECTIEETK